MTLQLKIRKIGNSLGIVLPKEPLARLSLAEGDFAHQIAIFEDVANRYRNTLRELEK